MTRRLLRAAALALVAGCGVGRPLDAPPAPPAYGAVSSVHYRDWPSVDSLAAALRWQPGAPVLVSAHRGGPTGSLPENALATFEYALNFAPALVETDVRRAADGTLVLLHDETLDRTTTGAGPVAAQPLDALRRLYLRDAAGTPTSHRIPTLAEALAWAEGRTVLMLDVKQDVPPESVVAAIRAAAAEDQVVVVTYTLDDWRAYQRLAPDLLYSVAASRPGELENYALLAAGHRFSDPPRFLAFAGVGSVDAAFVAEAHARGIRVQVGTFGPTDEAAADSGPEAYRPLLDTGADVLATDNVPTAALATRRYQPASTPSSQRSR